MKGLPEDYLHYPQRQRGMDHEIYPFRALPAAQPVSWPNGARIALCIAVHMGHFPMDMPLKPLIAPGGMERPYPSYWDYTLRDYGNRIGVYRLMNSLKARGLPATALLSAVLARRYPVLMDDLAAAQWEITCAGLDMGRLHHSGVPLDEERATVQEAAALLRGRFGASVRGWHSPAHSESSHTLSLVAAAGFSFTTGWANDDMPYVMTTDAGRLICMPLSQDLSDQRMLHQQHLATEDFTNAILTAHETLDHEAQQTGSGRILVVPVTPWLMGVPHRIRAFNNMLDGIMARGRIWPATMGQIAEYWHAQNRD
ncbi:MAG: polysaccharide deacetylase family protein [Roseomonas sp.]|nr:polysaccharide deacetylase family protein [Roseomonas sp.]MCA3328722.1 polysaccharide deacetylase family protein [Roseomonas sp.]MCA3331926.1 polysaccharide deacetylase family protein [Roseomonas sp.]MCA3334574.1 polysaccharide deacetylase family protein [Roseomonas sp.]MCA3345381.1 polysaccharide deacetylase family protein [Roseomonas sp.]